jgi:transposase-like protein
VDAWNETRPRGGVDYPRSWSEFQSWFPGEAECIAYLERLRWGEGFRCPTCDGSRAWRTKRGLWVCTGCERQTSVTAGTIFDKTRTPLRTWFATAWHVTGQKTGVSALGLQRVMGFGYETAWAHLHKLRRAMVRPGRDRLHGGVEVDETYVGGEEEGRGG